MFWSMCFWLGSVYDVVSSGAENWKRFTFLVPGFPKSRVSTRGTRVNVVALVLSPKVSSLTAPMVKR